MDAVHVRRPVLVVARDREWAALADAFAADGLRGWQARKATDFLHARFLLQHEACDALLLDGASFLDEDGEVLVRLASRQGVPVVVLSGGEASGEGDDAAEDERQCLPRDLALEYPALLAESLKAAARCRRLRHDVSRAAEEVREWRQRADQLAALLWEAARADGHAQWCSQRSLMGRLQEELARAERRRAPLSLVVGEIQAGLGGEGPDLAARTWVVDRITQGKRRSDVAGQYGPHGFLLLLPDTTDGGAAACCRRLQELLRETPAAGPASLRVDFGTASYPTAGSAAGLLCRAEERLEQARAAPAGESEAAGREETR
jgi:GGDEF domain-containing protein